MFNKTVLNASISHIHLQLDKIVSFKGAFSFMLNTVEVNEKLTAI